MEKTYEENYKELCDFVKRILLEIDCDYCDGEIKINEKYIVAHLSEKDLRPEYDISCRKLYKIKKYNGEDIAVLDKETSFMCDKFISEKESFEASKKILPVIEELKRILDE